MSESTILFDNEQLRAQLLARDHRIRLLKLRYRITCLLFSSVLTVLGILWYYSSPDTAAIVAIEQSRFIQERDQQFDLSSAILYYDHVAYAVESYRQDHGSYPADLHTLVPAYLRSVPGIAIRNGEKVSYSPTVEYIGGAPFTLYVYGQYPGLASMHGWELRYCPVDIASCNDTGDRHYHPFRVNHRWIWISWSAL